MVDNGSSNLNDLMYAKVLSARQKHARLQAKDYSHVFRKKSFLEILRLSVLSTGIGVVYAAETAFVSPTLLQIGVDHATMTKVWALSPILGLLLGPFLGSISDRCKLILGRRRPIILLLSLGIVVGFICIPFGRNIGQFFGEDGLEITSVLEVNGTVAATTTELPAKMPNLKITIILTVLGATLMDFAGETCQNPARAYMLDVCIPQDHNKVLSTYSIMTGLGSTLGYAIGGIDWESTALGQLIGGGNLQTAFMIDGILFSACFFITFFSFREIPLPLIERDKKLQPLTMAAFENGFFINNISNNHNNLALDDLSSQVDNDIKTSLKCLDSFSIPTKVVDTSINVEVGAVSLRRYLKSIVVMPRSLWILNLTNLLCWMGHITYCIYFTDFVGEKVFHGDPTAPIMSPEYNSYVEGVRFGGFAMAIYALSCCIYSFIIEKLMVCLKPKYVYIFGIIVFAIGIFSIAAWPSKLGVVLISVAAGILCGTVYTIPYIIVANYHAKGCFEKSNGENIRLKEPRGLGTDIAIVSSMVLMAQLIISLSTEFLVTWMGTTSAIFYVSSGLSVCAAVSAAFVLYI